MNPALVAIAIVTVGGAVLAVSSRDVRATLLGLLVVLLGAPLIADPWPDPIAILARTAATLLAIRLIAIGLRGDLATDGSRIGWPAETLLAAAAAVVGFGSRGLGSAELGPAEAQAAGFALVAVAAAPLLIGRDALRLATGAVLFLVAASLVRAGLDPGPSQAEQLVAALLTIALGGAVAVIVTTARTAGGLDQVDAGGPGVGVGLGGAGRRVPDAHRPTVREATARVPGRGPGAPSPRPDRSVPGPGGRSVPQGARVVPPGRSVPPPGSLVPPAPRPRPRPPAAPDRPRQDDE